MHLAEAVCCINCMVTQVQTSKTGNLHAQDKASEILSITNNLLPAWWCSQRIPSITFSMMFRSSHLIAQPLSLLAVPGNEASMYIVVLLKLHGY